MDVLLAYWVVGVVVVGARLWTAWDHDPHFAVIRQWGKVQPPGKFAVFVVSASAVGAFIWPVTLGWWIYDLSCLIYYRTYEIYWWCRLPPHIRRIARRNKNPRG